MDLPLTAFVTVGIIVIIALVGWATRAGTAASGRQRQVVDVPSVAIDADVQAKVRAELGAGRKITAIKVLREHTGLGLADAKTLVEAMSAGHEPAVPGATASNPAGSGVVTGPLAVPLTAGVQAELRAEIGAGRKISAIKRVREVTDLGLADAKTIVDAMEAGHRQPVLGEEGPPAAAPVEPAPSASLAQRARELRADGREMDAIRLLCDEAGMSIPEAQKFLGALD